MTAFVQELWSVSLALAPWLLLGAAIAGVLHVVLPPNFIRRHLEGRGGVYKSVLLGVPLPLCSCGVIPTGLGLKKDGASDGATVGFLISTPQTGVDSLFVSASFLGWPFAFFKLFSAAITGIVGGLWADHGKPVESHVSGTDEAPAPRTARAALDHSLDVLRTIWHWIVFGVVASAAIGAFVPDAWLQGAAGYGTGVALLAALVVSLPLYVCATASVPIAAALVAGGFPAGAALVFLMAGPATNLATLGAVYRTLGRRCLVVYLTTIVIGSLVLGYAFDFVLPQSAALHHHHHGEASILASVSVAFLAGLLGWFAIDDLRRYWSARGSAAQTCDLTVGVEGLKCQGCVRKLEGKLRDEPGVEHVLVDLDEAKASVRGTIDDGRLRELVRASGFTPVA